MLLHCGISATSSACTTITSASDTKWERHPKNERLVLAFDYGSIRLHKWEDLQEIAVFDILQVPLGFKPDSTQSITKLDSQVRNFKIFTSFPDTSGSQILIQHTSHGSRRRQHHISVLQTSEIFRPSHMRYARSRNPPRGNSVSNWGSIGCSFLKPSLLRQRKLDLLMVYGHRPNFREGRKVLFPTCGLDRC